MKRYLFTIFEFQAYDKVRISLGRDFLWYLKYIIKKHFLAVLGIELGLILARWVLYYLSPALFVLIIFEIGSHFTPMPGWTSILLFVLPCIEEMTGLCHCKQPLVEMGSQEHFTQVCLEPQQFSDSHLLSS
jgi:hypothetical protein